MGIPLSLLLVEDDYHLAQELMLFLSDFFEDIVITYDSAEAIVAFEQQSFDVVLSDIQLPGQSGLELVERIQKKSPDQMIYVMSAYKEVDYFLKSIELKVDGFITKPFDSQKLITMMMKLTTQLRERHAKRAVDKEIHLGEGISFDPGAKELKVRGVAQSLTRKEEALLEMLIKQVNFFVPSEQIIEVLWPNQSVSESTLRALVKRLRAKLGDEERILNLKGRGYRLKGPKED